MNRSSLHLPLAATLLLAAHAAHPAHAADVGQTASGLASTSLEDAGGPSDELGNSGIMRHAIPIEVPAARGGRVTPNLQLHYDARTAAGFFGKGWNITENYLEKETMRRTPTGALDLDEDGRFQEDRFVHARGGGRERLTSVGTNKFRRRREHEYLVYSQTTAGWEALDGLGTRYLFTARQRDANGVPVRWHLSKVIDTNGNEAYYYYRATNGTTCIHDADAPNGELLTLQAVAWNNYATHTGSGCPTGGFKDMLELVYRPRTDRIYVATGGAIATIDNRVEEIRLLSRDETQTPRRVRTLHLRYEASPRNQRALLRSVQLAGFHCEDSLASPSEELDCPEEALLPRTSFTYSFGGDAFSEDPIAMSSDTGPLPDHMSFLAPISGGGVTGGAFEERGALVDMNGDGRSDLLSIDFTYPNDHEWRVRYQHAGDPGRPQDLPFGGAEFWESSWYNLERDGSNFLDMNGDGKPDLLITTPTSWTVRYNTGAWLDPQEVDWNIQGVIDFLADHLDDVPNDEVRNALQACAPNPACNAEHEIDPFRSHGVQVSGLRDLTGDAIPDYVVSTSKDSRSMWWVFAGFIEAGTYSEPARGGFSSHPIPWRFVLITPPNPPSAWSLDYFPLDHEIVDGTYSPQFAADGVAQLIDVNGDGLLDYFGQQIYLNNGSGFSEVVWDNRDPAPDGNPWNKSSDLAGNPLQTATLADFNGDGLADHALRVLDTNYWAIDVAYNTGHGFTARSRWIREDVFLHGVTLGRWERFGSAALQRAGLADLTGDGLLDYVHSTEDGVWTVYPNNGAGGFGANLPDELVQISNGIGGATRLRYAASVQFPDVQLPMISYLITGLEPLILQEGAFANAGAETVFSYRGGRLHPGEDHLHQFRGFTEVTHARAGAGQTNILYNPEDEDLADKVRELRKYTAGGVLGFTMSNIWDLASPGNVTTIGSVKIPFLKTAISTIYDPITGSSVASERKITTLDDFGNILVQGDLGAPESGLDDLWTVIAYASSTGSNVVAAPSRIARCEDAACLTILGVHRFRYDGAQGDPFSALPDGQIERGNLKRVTADIYDLDQPGAPLQTADLRRFAYDARGNRTLAAEMFDAANARVVSTGYDSTYSLYPTSELSGLNLAGGTKPDAPLSISRTYELTRGLVESEIDPTTTRWFSYDRFGRPASREAELHGTRVLLWTSQLDFLTAGYTRTETEYETTTEGRTKIEAHDGLGRLVRVASPLGADFPGEELVEKVVAYDALGRTAWIKEPHRSTNFAPLTTYTFYDGSGAVRTVIRTPFRGAALPSELETTNTALHTFVTRMVHGVDQNRLYTQVTDPQAKTYRRYSDVKGRASILIDRAGRRVDYNYDRLGNLNRTSRVLRVEAPFCTTNCGAEHTIADVMTFDSLGRKRTLRHPDRGWLRYEFDLAGNLLRREAAEPALVPAYDRALVLNYDLQSRVLGKTAQKFQGGAWVPVPSSEFGATYTYDSAPSGHPEPTHVAGRLAAMSDPTGTTYYGYDELAHLTYAGKNIAGLGGAIHAIRAEYGRAGRLHQIDYDGREQIEHQYNSAGWLTELTTQQLEGGNWIDRWYYNVDSFSELGAPARVFRSDGAIVENFGRDPVDHRLEALDVSGGTGAYLVSLAYDTYDAVGNLTSMRDRRDGTAYGFTYTPDYQLLSASATGPGQEYGYQFVYDSLGNIRQRRDTMYGTDHRTFYYRDDGTVPHLPTGSRGDLSWSGAPDAVLAHGGGVLSREDDCAPGGPCTTVRALEYTEDELLERVALGANGEVEYAYDGLGTRVRQEVTVLGTPQRTIHTIAGLLELINENGQQYLSWHVVAGGRRLLTRTELAAETHYIHDHAGSVRATADRWGAELSRTNYLPYGKIDGSTSTGTSRFAHTGQELEPAAGLYFHGTRYYDPELMRFISPDGSVPEGNSALVLHRYAYAFNNPISNIDPDGRDPLLFIIAAAVMGGVKAASDAEPGSELEAFIIGAAVSAVGAFVGEILGNGAFLLIQALDTAKFGAMTFVHLGWFAYRVVSTAVGFAFDSIGHQLATTGAVDWGIVLREAGIGAIKGGLGAAVETGFSEATGVSPLADVARIGAEYVKSWDNFTTFGLLHLAAGGATGLAKAAIRGEDILDETLLGALERFGLGVFAPILVSGVEAAAAALSWSTGLGAGTPSTPSASRVMPDNFFAGGGNFDESDRRAGALAF